MSEIHMTDPFDGELTGDAAILRARIWELEAQLARMQQPVSDEEWEQNSDIYIELDAIGRPDVTNDGSWSIRTAVERRVFDSILAARAQAAPKEGTNAKV